MNVLLIGSGGREHALAWKLAQSPLLTKLFCAPGNAGMVGISKCIELDVADHQAVIDFCNGNQITLVVVGPEQPLVDGLVDTLENNGISAFGPSAKAARLEGSKGFTKDLCANNNIPTAAYQRFNNAPKAKMFARSQPMPLVVKVDGLAAGKGVIIAENITQALNAIDDCFEGEFGAAGTEVVIEQFLIGEEASMFFLCDGNIALPFGTAQDHKRAGEGDTGPNTGGMGAYSPAPVLTDALIRQTIEEIVEPTLKAMLAMDAPFKGVLYAGLMIDDDGPKLIEYNVRFGDPECQVLLMRLDSDLLPVLVAAVEGRLAAIDIQWSNQTALGVVLASNGYPGVYEKGSVINGLKGINNPQLQVFHAGTALNGDQIIATGGRVLNVTALGETVSKARTRAYDAVDRIDWPQGFCRRDIGWRAIDRINSR